MWRTIFGVVRNHVLPSSRASERMLYRALQNSHMLKSLTSSMRSPRPRSPPALGIQALTCSELATRSGGVKRSLMDGGDWSTSQGSHGLGQDRAWPILGSPSIRGHGMLELRPSCECCNIDLPPESTEARICSFECTFCARCADERLDGKCPNCGGELVSRPRRPASKLSGSPASTVRVFRPEGCTTAD